MNKRDIQEWFPVVVVIVGTVFSGIAIGLSLEFINIVYVLLWVTVIGLIGVFFSGLPLIEYILILLIAAVISFAVAPTWKYIIVLPGICMGYYWSCVLADILNRRNIERAQFDENSQKEFDDNDDNS